MVGRLIHNMVRAMHLVNLASVRDGSAMYEHTLLQHECEIPVHRDGVQWLTGKQGEVLTWQERTVGIIIIVLPTLIHVISLLVKIQIYTTARYRNRKIRRDLNHSLVGVLREWENVKMWESGTAKSNTRGAIFFGSSRMDRAVLKCSYKWSPVSGCHRKHTTALKPFRGCIVYVCMN